MNNGPIYFHLSTIPIHFLDEEILIDNNTTFKNFILFQMAKEYFDFIQILYILKLFSDIIFCSIFIKASLMFCIMFEVCENVQVDVGTDR